MPQTKVLHLTMESAGARAIDADDLLVLHGNGADTSTTITDDSLSPRTVTAQDDAQIDTAQFMFGGASILFDGDDFLSVTGTLTDFDTGAGDFDIEFRCRPTNLDDYGQFLVVLDEFDAPFLTITFDPAIGVYMAVTNAAVDPFYIDGVTEQYPQLALNTWTTIRYVKAGDVFYVFQDGVLISTGTNWGAGDPINTESSVSAVYIGANGDGSSGFIGNIDEFVYCKVSRGIISYTVPTSELGGAAGFADSSTYAHPITTIDTADGEVTIDTVEFDVGASSAKFTNTDPEAITENGAVIEVSHNPVLNLNGDDFEIEFRVKFSALLDPTTLGPRPKILSKGNPNDIDHGFFIDFSENLGS